MCKEDIANLKTNILTIQKTIKSIDHLIDGTIELDQLNFSIEDSLKIIENIQ